MIIKYIPEDFIVQEVLVTDHTPQDSGQPYLLLNLDKKGWSTFNAIHAIETWFGMPGYKKQTHLIGEALYYRDYQKAFAYLLESGTREASLPFDGGCTPASYTQTARSSLS